MHTRNLKGMLRSGQGGLLLVSLLGAGLLPAADDFDLGAITITGTREAARKDEVAETVGGVSVEELSSARPAHPSEVLGRIPGVHINVTGGEGHQTAIRQPLTTSPVYLYLEDGIPTRSTGFFNHNALYEMNLPQAEGVEIVKGPGTALYGSDAIGGVINVITRPAPLDAEVELGLEAGEYGWQRLLASAGNSWGNDGLRADLNLTTTDGWRKHTAYDRQTGALRWDRFLDGNASLKTVFSMSNIDQETAGSSRLFLEDYLHNPTENYTPISHRKVQALRLSSAYEKETANTLLSITPYVRSNTMELMPNWSLSYDPHISETSHDSLGMLVKYRRDFAPASTRLVLGVDLDHSPGSRLEYSIDTVRVGNVYTDYSIGQLLYDYDVTFQGVSPYVHVEASPLQQLRLSAGLRYDHLSYRYINNMSDNPLVIGFRTYYHPADATVSFSRLSPKLGAVYAFSEQLNGFVSYRHAFRAPSEGQLFRPGRDSGSLELKPVRANNYEIGLRGRPHPRWRYEVSYYYMLKQDDILTYIHDDGTRSTLNAGETLHRGLELGTEVTLGERLNFKLAYSNSRHTFEDWQPQPSVDYSGYEMSSAPREIINAVLAWKPVFLNGGRAELEWQRLGKYWMDDANTTMYDGHDLWHARGSHYLGGNLEVYARIMNLLDERYATAASFTVARGEEYAPGMPRTFYAGINYRWD